MQLKYKLNLVEYNATREEVIIMVSIERLQKAISDSGITMTALSAKSGIERATLYNRLNGVGEFTASEITGIVKALRLTNAEREQIFFAE